MRGIFFVSLFLLGSSLRANPIDELLRLVPQEATVCFIVQDLRGHAARISASPFADWLKSSPWAKNVAASDDWKKLEAAQAVIAQTLGVKPAVLRDDIFGDTVVYAYIPGSGEKSEPDAGVLFTQARDPKLLATVVAKINESQQSSGEVMRVVERKHSGVTFLAREKPGGRADFYLIDGGLLIYSSQERPMKLALERKAKAPPLAEVPPQFSKARKQLGFEKAAFVGLFAPRSIDAEMKTFGELLPNAEAKAFLQQFAKFWAAVEAIGLALEVDQGVQISLGFVSDREKVPEAMKSFLAPPQASAVWSAVPMDAFFAIAGQIRWKELTEMGRSFLSEAGKAKFQQWLDQSLSPIIGRDLLPEVLKHLGPDWGGWIAPPTKDSKAFLPTATFALRLPAAESSEAKVRDAVKSGIDFFVQAYRVDYNKKHDDQFRIDNEQIGNGRVTVLTNEHALPSGVRPSYGLRGDFLVVGSTPEAVSGFPTEMKAKPEHAGLLVRFSGTRTAKYLNDHGKELSVAIAKQSGRDAETLQREFAALASVLEMFESWELRHTGTGDLTKFTWKIEFAKPLK
jgi:hypothetical protein